MTAGEVGAVPDDVIEVDDGEVRAWREGDGLRLWVQTDVNGSAVSHYLSPDDATTLALSVPEVADVFARERELAEKMAFLRAGCANATRDELVQRITAVGAAEWKAGDWLTARTLEETAPLRARIAELEAQITQVQEWISVGPDRWDATWICRQTAALLGIPTLECTGIAATWCPVHGNCTCPSYGADVTRYELDDPTCPLHSASSTHAEGATG